MKPDEIKKAVNSVKADAFMQTRLKQKVESKANKRKSTAKPLISSILAVCMLAAVGLYATNYNVKDNNFTSTEAQSTNDSKRYLDTVMVVYAQDGKIENKKLKLNVTTPLKYSLKVYDIRNKNEKEIEALKDRLRKQNQDEENSNGIVEYKRGTEYLDNIILQKAIYNSFVLDIDDPTAVKQIELKTNTDYWYFNYRDSRDGVELENMFPQGNDLTIDGDTYVQLIEENKRDGYDMLCINLEHDMNLCSAIDKNPDIDLSTFDDTLTFIVEYKNGVVEESNVTISLDDNGVLNVNLI